MPGLRSIPILVDFVFGIGLLREFVAFDEFLTLGIDALSPSREFVLGVDGH